MTKAEPFAHQWVIPTVSLVVQKADLDPGYVTSILGIAPTSTRLPGADAWHPGSTDGLWVLRRGGHAADTVSEQLDAMLASTAGAARALRELAASGHRISLRIQGYAGNNAGFHLTGAQVGGLAALGVALEVVPNTNER
ncbi:DUF4279 domain-containing protein [Streptomyces sp. TRM 70351]|uniref:DUF4279 domain-containing protein n=1 Tax=Streptomyces sp. TRM 70351 TaxID=3116552 RepID=UPI002E7B49BF|nr:DUF4279 domain-containing protein [Streptomyces sp. TRM 70351]MEE1928201.1 DUF4279 domain-containing protein [Streptomyces sp. TRM 70351]